MFHSLPKDRDGWQTVRNDLLFSNPYVQVFATEVTTPTRSTPCDWTVVHRKAAVVVAAITAEGGFVLVRQERIAVRESLWEFPAGQIDESFVGEEEMIRNTAMRELQEEAGYEIQTGAELQPLGHFYPSAGFTDEFSYLLLARPVVPSSRGTAHDAHEAITECRVFSLAELRAMIASNEIRDANTLSAFARLCAMDLL